MNTRRRRSPALVAAVVAATSITTGLTALLAPAHATAAFTLSRLAGADRYLTASAIDQAAYPSGEPTVLLADGLSRHQSDALSAAGVEGAFGVGVLLTDDTGTVPSSTLSALSANKVQKIVVVGGTSAVTQSQINQLQSKGYQVTTPYQGASRWQTMKMVDESMGGAGADASGNATAILASGEDTHLVDALSAGGISYAKHFPIILTNSTGPGLQPEAQQVISDMGIKHLIVVGGTASIPATEYSPPPSGVTKVDVESGKDRSETSKVLADFAISSSWLTDTHLTVARGDDGADALAGAALSGVRGWPTVVTNSPSDNGSSTAFATEHTSTLNGTSYVFGGTSAVPDSQLSAIQKAGQGGSQTGSPAPAGTFGTAAGTTPAVTGEDTSTFTEGGLTYTYKSGDTYQLVTTSSNPGSSPTCTTDSFGDFQSRLTNGDSVSGNYQPTGTSTFCLNDIAPHAPSSVTATTNTSGSGVTVSWTPPSTAGTDNISAYTVWRATATEQIPMSGQFSCPAAYNNAPGTSPQNPPTSSNGYQAVATVQGAASNTYNDTSATSGNSYCYAVSSDALAPAGTGPNSTQIGTAQPAAPSQLQPSNPSAQAGAGQPATGTFGTAGGSSPAVSSESGSSFVQGGQTYNYQSGDTYQLVQPASNPLQSPSCQPDSYIDFKARLTNGDAVSGNYQPSGTSTWCLNDIAPHPPTGVTATGNSTSGGIDVTWQVPPTAVSDAVTGYTVFRATAAGTIPMSGQFSCQSSPAYSNAPGTSPQNPPTVANGYQALATVSGQGGTSYHDPSATAGSAYCYAVSSNSTNAAGTTQIGTANAAGSNQLQPSTPAPATAPTPGAASNAPLSTSLKTTDNNPIATGQLAPGDVLTISFNQPMTVSNSYSLTLASPCSGTTTHKPDTCSDTQAMVNGANSQESTSSDGKTVTITMSGPALITSGMSPTIPLADMEVLSASGFQSSGSNGQNWNLPGSGFVGTTPTVSREFGQNGNGDLPQAPTVNYVVGNSGPGADTVSYKCNDESAASDNLTVYDSNGNKLGTAKCNASPATPSGSSSPFTFTSGATYLFTETGAGQESATTSAVAGPQPAPAMSSVATNCTSASCPSPAAITITYNLSMACNTVDTDASDYAVKAVNGSTTVTYTTGGNTSQWLAACTPASGNSSTVTLTFTGNSAFLKGYTVTVTAQNGTDTNTVCEPSPNSSVCEAVGDSKSSAPTGG